MVILDLSDFHIPEPEDEIPEPVPPVEPVFVERNGRLYPVYPWESH